MHANRTSPAYELKDDLARLCLSTARRDPNQKLAWVNSICILFLLIGILGARRGSIAIKPVPPIHQEVPVVVVPAVEPPQAVMPKAEQPEPDNQPRVLVVLPNAPNVNFGVPTEGTLVAPAALANAPQVAPPRVGSLNNTGTGGDRPFPPYPQQAMENGQQGTVVLLLTGDDSGNVASVDVKESSGFPFLDRATVEFVRNHWRLPTNTGTRLFQTSITYKLQLN